MSIWQPLIMQRTTSLNNLLNLWLNDHRLDHRLPEEKDFQDLPMPELKKLSETLSQVLEKRRQTSSSGFYRDLAVALGKKIKNGGICR